MKISVHFVLIICVASPQVKITRQTNNSTVAETSNDQGSSREKEEENEEEDTTAPPRKRSTRRENWFKRKKLGQEDIIFSLLVNFGIVGFTGWTSCLWFLLSFYFGMLHELECKWNDPSAGWCHDHCSFPPEPGLFNSDVWVSQKEDLVTMLEVGRT